ncbi:altered inheritance of mitochondria [Fusarium pseudocircinatum]|uniref:Altered inheritance of mitochondria n=1 Tax=Fusarium pseudocircinatum TaxID=56676 RepID=A0A8H5KX76_9HYPO|nr:altered inheritance of mitochondria [Fusarium pseudocircinatum]
MVPRLSSDSTAFTISHPDLHTGIIFVDEDLNITCIIDWGSATTGPVTELLATPGLAGSSQPPSVALAVAFQAGFSHESSSIKQDMWRKAEMNWYFSRLTGAENPSDSRDYGWLFHQRAMNPSNKQLLSQMSEYDLTDDEVKEREIDVFSGDKVERLAVARKLTLMSEMNPGFTGDRRLWRWIEEALKGSVYDSINENGRTHMGILL